jgi:hypothetical protein
MLGSTTGATLSEKTLILESAIFLFSAYPKVCFWPVTLDLLSILLSILCHPKAGFVPADNVIEKPRGGIAVSRSSLFFSFLSGKLKPGGTYRA